MAAGYSLHAGLDVSDHPRFRTRPSPGCARAAAAMHGLACGLGYRTPVLLQDAAATAGAFARAFRRLAASLEPGDLLLVSFAGHGRRLWGSGDAVRPHALYFRDRELLDAELGGLIDEIDVPARVVLVVDACGSGGLIRPRAGAEKAGARRRAEVLLLASCPPEALSRPALERTGLPPFTGALLRGWHASVSYADLRARIASIAGPGTGPPPLLVCGGAGGIGLAAQRPFVP
jgi:hypothetical protein